MNQNATFREKVHELTKQIPAGKVATYGQIASLAGSPGAARAVGMCMKTNPDNNVVPCHRVVGSDGRLVDFAFGGVSKKKEKLAAEGVSFIGDKVDLTTSLWAPEL